MTHRAYFWNNNGQPGERLNRWQVFIHHFRYACRLDDWKVIQMIRGDGSNFS